MNTRTKGLRRTAFAALLLLACSTALLAQRVQINGGGATFPYPIYSKWFSEYNKLHPNVKSAPSRNLKRMNAGM